MARIDLEAIAAKADRFVECEIGGREVRFLKVAAVPVAWAKKIDEKLKGANDATILAEFSKLAGSDVTAEELSELPRYQMVAIFKALSEEIDLGE